MLKSYPVGTVYSVKYTGELFYRDFAGSGVSREDRAVEGEERVKNPLSHCQVEPWRDITAVDVF